MNFSQLRLLTVIRKVKSTDFVKLATPREVQVTEFRFHIRILMYIITLTDEIWKPSRKSLSLPAILEDTKLCGLCSLLKIWPNLREKLNRKM